MAVVFGRMGARGGRLTSGMPSGTSSIRVTVWAVLGDVADTDDAMVVGR